MLNKYFTNRPKKIIIFGLTLVLLLSVIFLKSTISADSSAWRANSVSQIRKNINRHYDSATKLYRIQTGDTINTISEAFQTNGNQVVDDNGIRQANLIYAGSQLLINNPNTTYQPVSGTLGSHVAADIPTASLVSSFEGRPLRPISIAQ
ncbi:MULTISPECIES: LysM peptidoglycan-binding domain-containing protein [Leuconostoc]|uniref:LysM peptidoglycan-binding domain-containing protein n=1 Tax=Leuconostoc TaxID=1243 RepID=UPI0032DFC20A